jgi:DNA polymerase III epsilon subunit-like protein
MMSQARFTNLQQWARTRDRPVTIFDLETTTYVPHVDWLGITELGHISLFPDGRMETRRALVNPERRISSEVTDLTGICEADVADQPTWAAWASMFYRMAQEHIMVGFNSHAFDCVVVQKQNERYGVPGTTFADPLDVRALPEVVGTLSQAADRFGLRAEVAHRALNDAWLTASLAEAVAARHGLAALEAAVGVPPGWNRVSDPSHWSRYSPRAAREADLLEHYRTQGGLPDLDQLAHKHGIQRSTIESDVYRLAESGRISFALLDRPEVQRFLSARLPDAIAAIWVGAAVGKLKPLFTHLAQTAPAGFDYTQLRIGLARYKAGSKAA